jgi:hypothetical protein
MRRAELRARKSQSRISQGLRIDEPAALAPATAILVREFIFRCLDRRDVLSTSHG